MTVAELIEQLRTFPPSLPVVYACHSEYKLLEAGELAVARLNPARQDGWVHSYDPVGKLDYLVFPGN